MRSILRRLSSPLFALGLSSALGLAVGSSAFFGVAYWILGPGSFPILFLIAWVFTPVMVGGLIAGTWSDLSRSKAAKRAACGIVLVVNVLIAYCLSRQFTMSW